MSSLSNGDVIAIVTLIATCPPSIALLFHLIKRTRLNEQPDQTDIELANGLSQPIIGDLVESQVDLLIPRPGLAHVPAR